MSDDYRLRRHALEDECRWQLAADALECHAGNGRVQRWPYAALREVRLQYDPTRFNPDNYVCLLTLADGGSLRLPSTHYLGVGRFESRAGSYRPFIAALTARVAAASPGCRFAAGPRPARYWGGQLLQFAALLLLAVVIGVSGTVPPLFLLMLVVIYLPLAWHYGRRNRPQDFSPPQLPATVLPPEPRHD